MAPPTARTLNFELPLTATATQSTSPAPTTSLTWPIVGVIAALALVVVGVLLAGRRDEQLPVIYGRRRGVDAAGSVNGTAVLADLYRAARRRVSTGVRFSPALEKYNTIVWFPDDFAPPDEAHRQRLEEWLQNGSNRTLVYVGRDYDAAIDYWQRLKADASPELSDEILRRDAESRARHEAIRSAMPIDEYARWFAVRRDDKPYDAQILSGPWADGIDAKQTDIHLEGRVSLPPYGDIDTLDDPFRHRDFDVLLASGDEPLVFRLSNDIDSDKSWNKGQIIVLVNGSFTLNYPLVNHEHRKLAARLIEASSSADDRVLFIESQADGPPIRDKEKATSPPTSLELLKVWPLNAILLHIAVLGIVLCLARAPIFGRPRDLIDESPADFGKHIAALGKLLAATKDRNYAQTRLNQYRQSSGPKKPTKIK
jgi:hypothetical protein